MLQSFNDWVDSRIEAERQTFRKTSEYQLRQQINTQMDELMESNLTADQRVMMEEILLQKCEMLEQDGERLYRKGMKDAIWLLKKLGVIDMEE